MLPVPLHDDLPLITAAQEPGSKVPESAGTLYIVATPIGNLEDLSPRARRILDETAAVLCEDTRRTARLLAAIGVSARRISLHEHNEAARVPEILDGLARGASYALVADAGTPLVSDPGFRLVAAARTAGLPVSPIPGPCAAIAALSVAGLPSDRFCFEGFLPARATARAHRLAALTAESRTMIFYESGRRLQACIDACARAFGADREASLSREITKLFETLYRGTLGELGAVCAADPDVTRGELVLVVAGCSAETAETSDSALADVVGLLLQELPASRAARLAARLTGCTRQRAYAIASRLSRPGS